MTPVKLTLVPPSVENVAGATLVSDGGRYDVVFTDAGLAWPPTIIDQVNDAPAPAGVTHSTSESGTVTLQFEVEYVTGKTVPRETDTGNISAVPKSWPCITTDVPPMVWLSAVVDTSSSAVNDTENYARFD